jgi:hypothetical protein
VALADAGLHDVEALIHWLEVKLVIVDLFANVHLSQRVQGPNLSTVGIRRIKFYEATGQPLVLDLCHDLFVLNLLLLALRVVDVVKEHRFARVKPDQERLRKVNLL